MSTGRTLAALLAIVMLASSAAAQEPERIAEVRVHGNHTTPDADVLALAGLAVGDPADQERLRAADTRLRDNGRFADVDVRRRMLSIADPSQILIVIVVDELDAVAEDDLTPGPMKRLRSAGMWLPILNYADGYGFTYGARIAWVDPLGPHTRAAVPLTWGGERRAALELEKTFGNPPSGLRLPTRVGDLFGRSPEPSFRVRGSLAIYRRVNPFFDIADTRIEARVRGEHPFASWLRAGASARTARVDFGGLVDRHDAAGADVVVDTRRDQAFPRNAIHASAGWERLRFDGGDAGRWLTDVRGYVGIGGSAVLALRSQFALADAPLPGSEQYLLGGEKSLRGYRTGHRVGDNLAAFSLEARVPVNSPLSIGRFGIKAFVDSGTTWNAGERFRDARFERGIGGGIYFGATAVIGDLSIAWPESGNPRVHFGLGVSF